MWAGQACGGTRAGSVRCAGANQGRRAGLHCCTSQPSAAPLQNSAEFCRILVLQAAQRRGAQLRGGAEELGRGRRGDVPCVEADGALPECAHFASSLPTTLNRVVSQLRRCLCAARETRGGSMLLQVLELLMCVRVRKPLRFRVRVRIRVRLCVAPHVWLSTCLHASRKLCSYCLVPACTF